MTRGLEGANEDPPHWSRFFRVVDTKTRAAGTTVMKGADDQPLLVLSREGEGRVGADPVRPHLAVGARL